MTYCRDCQRHFASESSLRQHLDNSAVHAHIYGCTRCNKVFNSETSLAQHEDATSHWPLPPNYCTDCKRGFQSENNLRMVFLLPPPSPCSLTPPPPPAPQLPHPPRRAHFLSLVHADFRHRSHDTRGVITKNLIEYPGHHRDEVVEATMQTWNGYGFECFLCQREFSTLQALNSHLNSPTHRQKLYHCPKRSCARQFVSLAGLVNHFESESCGVMQFATVQSTIGGLVAGTKMISY